MTDGRIYCCLIEYSMADNLQLCVAWLTLSELSGSELVVLDFTQCSDFSPTERHQYTTKQPCFCPKARSHFCHSNARCCQAAARNAERITMRITMTMRQQLAQQECVLSCQKAICRCQHSQVSVCPAVRCWHHQGRNRSASQDTRPQTTIPQFYCAAADVSS